VVVVKALNYRSGGFIARRFDAEDNHQFLNGLRPTGVTAAEIIASPAAWADPGPA
jgi:hypothetical protein